MVDFVALRSKPKTFADKRAEAMWLMRSYMREEVEAGRPLNEIYRDMREVMGTLTTSFLVEHDMPGVRYWEEPHGNGTGKHEWHATTPRETELLKLFITNDKWIELDRSTWLARQGLADSVHDAI